MAVTALNLLDFDEVLSKNSLCMVDFWAGWCGPCRMVAPVIADVAERYDGKVLVGKVDVDAIGPLAERYGVMTIPTVIFFKDGKEIDRKVGVMPAEAYTQVLDANL